MNKSEVWKFQLLNMVFGVIVAFPYLLVMSFVFYLHPSYLWIAFVINVLLCIIIGKKIEGMKDRWCRR